mmetsp:Transcript_5469/g.4162  ORF Transcript_5469/g.4162 Transcript_5469/m.4162 type:complete len:130 (+) Transcript_5469:502-891(+)
MYLKPSYESKFNEHGNNSPPRASSPAKQSQFSSSLQPPSNLQVDRSSSPRRPPPSPGKLRGEDGKKHAMTMDEMKLVYAKIQEGQRHTNLQDEVARARDKYGAWSNREEEWYFTNKRLLFSSKAPEITK